jgi:hypothetical protein
MTPRKRLRTKSYQVDMPDVVCIVAANLIEESYELRVVHGELK